MYRPEEVIEKVGADPAGGYLRHYWITDPCGRDAWQSVSVFLKPCPACTLQGQVGHTLRGNDDRSLCRGNKDSRIGPGLVSAHRAPR